MKHEMPDDAVWTLKSIFRCSSCSSNSGRHWPNFNSSAAREVLMLVMFICSAYFLLYEPRSKGVFEGPARATRTGYPFTLRSMLRRSGTHKFTTEVVNANSSIIKRILTINLQIRWGACPRLLVWVIRWLPVPLKSLVLGVGTPTGWLVFGHPTRENKTGINFGLSHRSLPSESLYGSGLLSFIRQSTHIPWINPSMFNEDGASSLAKQI